MDEDLDSEDLNNEGWENKQFTDDSEDDKN